MKMMRPKTHLLARIWVPVWFKRVGMLPDLKVATLGMPNQKTRDKQKVDAYRDNEATVFINEML